MCAAEGVNATELDGAVAIVTSGAGSGHGHPGHGGEPGRGGQVRCRPRLLGPPDKGRAGTGGQVGARPEASVLLVNAFLQMASCKVLAESVASTLAEAQPGLPVVARLAGNDSDGVDALLGPSERRWRPISKAPARPRYSWPAAIAVMGVLVAGR